MPKLVVYGNLVFFIFACDLVERMHVYVSNTKSRAGRSAKIWLDTLAVFEQGSLTTKEIKLALELLEEHSAAIELSIRTFCRDWTNSNFTSKMRDVGFNTVRPCITQISFRKAGYVTLELADGRIISVPTTRFPGIARLTPTERRQHHIADGEIILFQNDDEVYHIQDFLGSYEANSYKSLAKRSDQRSPSGIWSTLNTNGNNFTIKSAKKKNVAADSKVL